MLSSTTDTPKHPAKYSDSILTAFAQLLDNEVASFPIRPMNVLDPMAGVGRIHELRTDLIETFSVELESEWVGSPSVWRTQGDATDLQWASGSFDAVMTSPAYGNRMADHHNAKDDSKRMTYKHLLGRDLSPNSGAGLQWGHEYRELHAKILAEMVRVSRPGGMVVVNMSNHIRKGKVQHVVEWWIEQMCRMGLLMERVIPVATPRLGFGANGSARVSHEHIIVTRKED